MRVSITIVGVQRADGEETRTETTAAGMLRFAGEQAILTYTERQEDGERIAVSVQCTDREVLVERRGAARSLLRLRLGERCVCNYGTPYGTFPITTHTHALQNALAADGTLTMAYTLEVGGGTIDHTLHLRVQEYQA